MSNRTTLFQRGYEFRNPDKSDEGYRLTRDVFVSDMIMADQFEAFGDVEDAVVGKPIPSYVAKAISLKFA